MTPTHDTPDLEAPTAPKPLQRQPALIIGAIGALLLGFLTLAGAGGLDDGWQWADAAVIGGPMLVALGIRQATFSQATVDLLADRAAQRRAVEARKAGVIKRRG